MDKLGVFLFHQKGNEFLAEQSNNMYLCREQFKKELILKIIKKICDQMFTLTFYAFFYIFQRLLMSISFNRLLTVKILAFLKKWLIQHIPSLPERLQNSPNLQVSNLVNVALTETFHYIVYIHEETVTTAYCCAF